MKRRDFSRALAALTTGAALSPLEATPANTDGSITETCPNGTTATMPAEASITACVWEGCNIGWQTVDVKADIFVANYLGQYPWAPGACVEAK